MLQRFLALLVVAAPAGPLSALDRLTYRDGDRLVTAEGRTLASDSAGGRMLQSSDGALWVAEAGDVESFRSDEAPFEPLGAKQLAAAMLAELPEGFRVHHTTHYVVCYGTSREYAQWTSSLLERLHRAFTAYWTRQGFELTESEFPLPVVIYPTAQQYIAASRAELGDAAGSVVGYYSLRTNVVTMHDLTGADALRRSGGGRVSRRDISRLLATPAAEPLVATIVHEATHQIAFNCGLQQRLADIPLWLLEGMATYFETPDLSGGRGWRGIGKVNRQRLAVFRQNLRGFGGSRLTALAADDKPFRNARTAGDAYADAWAMNYYLIHRRPKDYLAYVRTMSQREPLQTVDAETRLREFREHFGEPDALARELAEMMRSLR